MAPGCLTPGTIDFRAGNKKRPGSAGPFLGVEAGGLEPPTSTVRL